MANIARLGVALGLNSAEFVSGIDAATRKLDQFAAAAVGVGKNALLALGAALSVATYKAVAYADEIADVAAANDIAIDSIIKLTNALENSGGKGANAGKMIASFTDFVDKAAKGSFEGQKTFSQLGISLKDIGSLSTQDLLLKTTEAIAGIADPLTRNARAADAFGKAAKGVDMVDFSKGLREGKGATLEQEKAIKDAAQAFDLFKSVGKEISLLITESLGPSLLKLGQWLKALDISNLSFTIFGKFIGFGTSNDPTIRLVELNKEIAELGKQRELALGRPLVLSTIDREILALQREQDALIAIQRIKADETSKSQTKEKIDAPKRLTTLGINPETKAAADKAAAEAKRQLSEFNNLWQDLEKQKQDAIKKQQDLVMKGYEAERKDVEDANQAQAEQQGLYAQGNAQYAQRQGQQIILLAREQEMFKLEQKGRFLKAEKLQEEKEILQQMWKYIDAVETINAMENLDRESRREALAREDKLNEKALQNIVERGRILKSQTSGGLYDGFLARLDAVNRDMETSFETGGKAFDSLMGSMSKALDEFVTTGKLNFGDFAKSIIKDMLAIQLRAAATNLFAPLAKFIFPSVSLAQPFSGPRADGGPVESNSSYLVGERGPELFVPRGAGAIVPNHTIGSSQQAPTINYNGPYIASMSAIDTQSGLQFLAKNKQSVWSVYQSANRSIPMSR